MEAMMMEDRWWSWWCTCWAVEVSRIGGSRVSTVVRCADGQAERRGETGIFTSEQVTSGGEAREVEVCPGKENNEGSLHEDGGHESQWEGPRGRVRVQREEIKKVQDAKYFRSTVLRNGECRKEVKKKGQAVLNRWWKVWLESFSSNEMKGNV